MARQKIFFDDTKLRQNVLSNYPPKLRSISTNFWICPLDKIRSFSTCTCNVYVNIAMKHYRSQSAKERIKNIRRRSRRRFWLLMLRQILPWKVPAHRRRPCLIMSPSQRNLYLKKTQVGCNLKLVGTSARFGIFFSSFGVVWSTVSLSYVIGITWEGFRI